MRRAPVALLLAAAALTGCANRVVDAGPPTTTDQTVGSSTSSGNPPPTTPLAAVYAATIGTAPTGNTVYLHGYTCPDVAKEPPAVTCAATAIPAQLLDDLTRLLGGPDTVHVIGAGERPSGTVVTLGPSHVESRTATVQLAYECGPLCGAGTTYLLTRTNDGWHVTGQSGPGWIS